MSGDIPEKLSNLSLRTDRSDCGRAAKHVGSLAHCDDTALREMVTDHMRKVLRSSLAAAKEAKKRTRIHSIFKETFNPGGITVDTLNGGAFLHRVMDTVVNGCHITLSEMLKLSITGQKLLFFHALCRDEFRVKPKTLHAHRKAMHSSWIRFVVQSFVKV